MGLLPNSCRFPFYLLVAARLTARSLILTRYRILPSVFLSMLDKRILSPWKRAVEQTMNGTFPGHGGITRAGGGLPVAGRAWALADGARDFQKSPGLFCQRVEVSDAFIMQHQETWPMAVLCEGLEVNRRDFYAYPQGGPLPHGGIMT
jgi:hypothetical protein